MFKKLLVPLLLLFAVAANAQQKVIPLYNGPAPGSEKWTWSEQESADNMYHANTIYNVSKPTLTVYLPDSANASGTALIICPGGGFQSLSIMQEGYAVAKWCQQKGITAFLLKYRLMHTLGHDPYKQATEAGNSKESNDERSIIVPLAIADGKQALAYVRAHAAEYGLSPSRIGIIGFSAGGVIAVANACNYTPESKPDFVGAIYSGGFPVTQNDIPPDAPPMFIAAAENDTYNLEAYAVSLYNTWSASKHVVDLHIYSKGGHGFGMNKQGFESDTWADNFMAWLRTEGFLKPMSDVKTEAQKKAEDWANFQKLIEYKIHNDWPNLNRYDDDNKKLEAMPADPKRVVFMGNSITDNWIGTDSAFFKNNPYIDRGIGGQTTPQMLVRFREDVIKLKPAAVVILAGINDIAENTGPNSLENVFGNIVSMAELAQASHIRVVLCSVLPASDIPWHPGLQPIEKIIKLNNMIKKYAAAHGLVYTDYYDAMIDDQKGLKKKLAMDGMVHPNLAGYKIMEPLVQKAINETLKRK